jgi:hypothetical protein
MAPFFAGMARFWAGFPVFWFPGRFFALPDAHLSFPEHHLRKKTVIFVRWPFGKRSGAPSSQDRRPGSDPGRHLRSQEPIFLREGSSWLAERCDTFVPPQSGAAFQGTHGYDEILGAAAASA